MSPFRRNGRPPGKVRRRLDERAPWLRPTIRRSPASVSSTGWISVGEDAITRSTSLVAVCCSRASVRSRLRSCSSLNNRTFSMAITAWSAKVLSRAICFSEKGRTWVRRKWMTPRATPSRISGTARIVLAPTRLLVSTTSGYSVTITSVNILDMNDLPGLPPLGRAVIGDRSAVPPQHQGPVHNGPPSA